MKIEARLSFKNARIMQILKAHHLNIRDFCDMHNLDYQTTGNFIRFKNIPASVHMIFAALHSLDRSLELNEIYPKNLKEIIDVLQPRTKVGDIPDNLLVSTDCDRLVDESMSLPDEDVLRAEVFSIVDKALSGLHERDARVVCMYYGIGFNRCFTGEEIGKRLERSDTWTQQVRGRSLRHLFKNEQLKDLCVEPEYTEIEQAHKWPNRPKRFIWSYAKVDEDGLVV